MRRKKGVITKTYTNYFDVLIIFFVIKKSRGYAYKHKICQKRKEKHDNNIDDKVFNKKKKKQKTKRV